MELELQGWKVKLALAALVLVVVAAPLARAVNSNRDRAEDWHRRAIVAEESVARLPIAKCRLSMSSASCSSRA